jgi:hypothetical protein
MFAANTRYLQAVTNYCYTNKPVFLEEFGWLGSDEAGDFHTDAYLSRWNCNAVNSTTGLVTGWAVWAMSDTPTSTDCTKWGGLFTAKGALKQWGKDFKVLSEKLTHSQLKRTDQVKSIEIDERMALTADVRTMYPQYLEMTGIAELTPEPEEDKKGE